MFLFAQEFPQSHLGFHELANIALDVFLFLNCLDIFLGFLFLLLYVVDICVCHSSTGIFQDKLKVIALAICSCIMVPPGQIFLLLQKLLVIWLPLGFFWGGGSQYPFFYYEAFKRKKFQISKSLQLCKIQIKYLYLLLYCCQNLNQFF